MKKIIFIVAILSILLVTVIFASDNGDYWEQTAEDSTSEIEYENQDYDEDMEEDDYLPIGLKNYLKDRFAGFTQDEELYYERVNQGQVANSGQFPFQAGLQIRRDVKQKFWCGGALISPEWVLTAAHCIDRATHIKLILGAQDRKNSHESGRVKRIISIESTFPYEDWNNETLANDIALVRLDPPVEFTDRISSIALPDFDHMRGNFTRREAWITGWGRYVKKCKKLSSSLRFAVGRILTNEECIESYVDRILESHVCFNGTDRQGVCRGDSGGPLFIRDPNKKPILIGLASFGRGCGSRAPGVFARVSYYLKWIKNITGILSEDNEDVTTELNWKDLDPFR